MNRIYMIACCALLFGCEKETPDTSGITLCHSVADSVKTHFGERGELNEDTLTGIHSEVRTSCIESKAWESHKAALTCYTSIKSINEFDNCPKEPLISWVK